MLKIALVNSPFTSTRYPSIQLGLLKSILLDIGHKCDVHYANISFAKVVGWQRYEAICEQRFHQIGEWIFSRAAFGDSAPPASKFVERFGADLGPLTSTAETTLNHLIELREEIAPRFITEYVESLDWGAYDLVGFGSMFEQNCAALALAHSIKDAHPRIKVVFGGSNFDDPMGLEYMRLCPWIDHAVVGEGDITFPRLLEAIDDGISDRPIPGVLSRNAQGEVQFTRPSPPTTAMDRLPTPNYDEFFEALRHERCPDVISGRGVSLLFESARGCWWGEKQHCTFCGLNVSTMAFRSKSAQAVLEDIAFLVKRYNRANLQAVDNILDVKYTEELFGYISEKHYDYELFYELKSNMKPDTLRTLARGGLVGSQPGIESLSANVLKLMRKGVTPLQNILHLKWSQQYGINPSWNMIFGFPGERSEDYADQSDLIRKLLHLKPPASFGRLRLDRYSPHYAQPEKWGFRNVRAYPSYRMIYPTGVDVDLIAYHFVYETIEPLPYEAHLEFCAVLQEWQDLWHGNFRPHLYYLKVGSKTHIIDGRDVHNQRQYGLEDTESLVLSACERQIQSLDGVSGTVNRVAPVSDSHIESAIRSLLDRGLAIEEDGLYLSLPLPINKNALLGSDA